MVELSKLRTSVIMILGLTTIFMSCWDYILRDFGNSMLLFFIGIISIFRTIYFNKYAYSLDSFHWMFILFFCSVAPIMQASYGQFPWGMNVDSNLLTITIFILIIWLFIYSISYEIGKNIDNKFKSNKKCKNKIEDKELIVNSILLLIISFISTILVMKFLGFENLFSRAIGNDNVDFNTQKISILIMENVIRNIPLICSSILFIRYKKISNIYFLLSFICTIITKFPTGIGRFTLAVAYIGLLVIIFNKFFSSSKKLELILSVGIMYIFPLTNIFRYIEISKITLQDMINNFKTLNTSFQSGDFDAFSIFMRAVDSINYQGPILGAILGSLLFFIPRKIWSTKPVGSGTYIANMQGLSFDNLSTPIMAEGYINGGIIGVVILAFIIGIILGIVDSRYWKMKNMNYFEYTYLYLVYPYLLGYMFTNCRGALISTYAYTVAFLLIAFILYKVSKLKIRF